MKRDETWDDGDQTQLNVEDPLASRCTPDRLQVSLRIVTFCHGVLRSARFITAVSFLISAVTAVADF